MKRFDFTILGLCLLWLLGNTSCESDSNTTLNVDKSEITISADGGYDVIHISSNTSWSITNDNENISISPTSGSGDADIKISLPETWAIKEHQTRLVISTSDGAVIKNVTVVQKTKFLDGVVLQIISHGQKVIFGGEANAPDSIVIYSNVPWQMKGPEWIEAYDGIRWVKLSDSRATVTSRNNNLGTEDYVYLRTASQNESDGNRAGTLTITPLYEGDITVEEKVIQLGRYGIIPNKILPMCNSIACDWKKGISVEKFYIAGYSKEYDDNDFTDEEIRQWDLYSPEYLGTFGNLEAGQEIYFYAAGIDNSGKFHVNHVPMKTASEEGQPIAEITNVGFDGNLLVWDTQMNDYCASYFQITLTNLLDDYDATIAWLLYYNGGLNRYMENGHFELHTNNQDAQIITWGILKGSNTLAGTLGRHITTYWSKRFRDRGVFSSRCSFSKGLLNDRLCPKKVEINTLNDL